MPAMLKKKPIRTGEPVHVWVNGELVKALQTYLDTAKPTPSKTAAVETALEEFLASRGFWPPAMDE